MFQGSARFVGGAAWFRSWPIVPELGSFGAKRFPGARTLLTGTRPLFCPVPLLTVLLGRDVRVKIARFLYLNGTNADFLVLLRLRLNSARRAVNLNVIEIFLRNDLRRVRHLLMASRTGVRRYRFNAMNRVLQVRFSNLHRVIRHALMLLNLRNDLLAMVMRRIIRFAIRNVMVNIVVRRNVAHLIYVRTNLNALRRMENDFLHVKLNGTNRATIRRDRCLFNEHLRRFLNLNNARRNDQENRGNLIRFVVTNGYQQVILLNGLSIALRLSVGQGLIGNCHFPCLTRDFIRQPVLVGFLKLTRYVVVSCLNPIMVRVVFLYDGLRDLVRVYNGLVRKGVFAKRRRVLKDATRVAINANEVLYGRVVRDLRVLLQERLKEDRMRRCRDLLFNVKRYLLSASTLR